tara:strand:+ start:15336 stop:16406 length:1071 start_codon:yes stop_codon:yes gene_type:complete
MRIDMFGVIMAGGQGTRLYPLTKNRPKPMVEVLGRPVIEFVKDAMVNSGVTNIIVTTGYKGEMLEQLVESWSSNDSRLSSSKINQENTPMGTAGSVRLLVDQLKETFVVGSGDSVLSCNLENLIHAHKKSNAKVTIGLWQVTNPSEFGIVGLSKTQKGELDGSLDEGFVVKFLEKPEPKEAFSDVINAGLYIIEPDVLELIPMGEKYDFSKQLFPKLLDLEWPIYAKKIEGVWFDVGLPNELISAQHTLIKDRESLPFKMPEGEVIGTNGFEFSKSSSQAINRGSVLSAGAIIGKDTFLQNSLIMKETNIGNNCKIINSVIGCNVKIGDFCSIENCVIGDNAIIESNTSINGEKLD